MNYFKERKTFTRDTTELRSLSTGVIGDKSVNVDAVEDIGSSWLSGIEGNYQCVGPEF